MKDSGYPYVYYSGEKVCPYLYQNANKVNKFERRISSTQIVLINLKDLAREGIYGSHNAMNDALYIPVSRILSKEIDNNKRKKQIP